MDCARKEAAKGTEEGHRGHGSVRYYGQTRFVLIFLAGYHPDLVQSVELGIAAMTAVWIRKEHEQNIPVPNGAALWIASGLEIINEQ